MFGDGQGPRKSSGEENEEYMPDSCTELTQALLDYARTQLNETEENKGNGLQEIEEFVERE